MPPMHCCMRLKAKGATTSLYKLGNKIHDGGGIHDEEIELYYLPIQKAKTFALDDTIPKTPGLMFTFYWFFDTFDKRT